MEIVVNGPVSVTLGTSLDYFFALLNSFEVIQMSSEGQTFEHEVGYFVQDLIKVTSLFGQEAVFCDGDLFKHGSCFHLAKLAL